MLYYFNMSFKSSEAFAKNTFKKQNGQTVSNAKEFFTNFLK